MLYRLIMQILLQETAVLSIVTATLITDSLFLMNFKCEPVNTLNHLGEKISTKAPSPIVAQTKQKKKHYSTQKVKTIYIMCRLVGFSHLHSSNVLCFSISVTLTV